MQLFQKLKKSSLLITQLLLIGAQQKMVTVSRFAKQMKQGFSQTFLKIWKFGQFMLMIK